MDKLRLGRTDLRVGRSAFGALPIQRIGMEEAVALLQQAFEGGMTFFDTARGYTDSEEKIGRALAPVRREVVLATKTHARDRKTLFEHLEQSLRLLRTDHVDLYQLHNPPALPDPADPDGLYAALLEAKSRGLVRHIGLTNHRLALALDAAASGLYDTIQFPLNLLSTPEELALVDVCRRHDVGLIAMKALSGGLVTRADAAFAFLRQYDNVLPIWGLQHPWELEAILALESSPPPLDAARRASIERDRAELAGSFCRGCGYCLPCPENIPIPMAARMSLLLSRGPTAGLLSPEWQEQMDRIESCRHCGQCSARCPYGLDTPALLEANLADYRRRLGTS